MMHNTRFALPLIAITLVVMLIAPGYAMAADEAAYATNTIRLQIDSEHADEYSEVVNVAEASAITNPDTWDPAPQGIWIGASTKESLFAFDTVATSFNRFHVASEVRFNSSQIMNGVSCMIVRSPISADGVDEMRLRVWALTGENWDLDLLANPYAPITGDVYQVAGADIDMTDTSITGGTDAWTVDNRTYVRLYAPIYSGVSYIFAWTAIYHQDERFRVYLSGQDIANDNITKTRIGQYTLPDPDRDVQERSTFNIDPGISFDMITGLGNGVWAQSWYMDAGDTLSFEVAIGIYSGSPYHTVMIPYGTDDGTLNATVTVYYPSSSTVLWTDDNTEWRDYILACPPSPVPGSPLSVRVVVTVNQAERVNWIFVDSPSGSLERDMDYNRAALKIDGVTHTVHARPWSSYQLSLGEVIQPSLNPADWPPMVEEITNQQSNYYGTIIGAILVVIGGVAVATGVLAPIGFLIGGMGAVMIAADLQRGGTLINGNVQGWLSNPLDAIWDTLVAVGEFLWSVGEALYDAITWIVDAINDYLPILLGLLIIGVALALFFVPIYAQLKLWGITWSLAEGNLQKAAAQASDLAGEAEDVYKGAKKIKRRLF
jgi:hypothetical protein